MRSFTKSEVIRILQRYDADHDLGPDAPITWREERLANAVLEMQEQIDLLDAKISAILDAVPSANRVRKI
jgi:hypothetical protein